MKTDMDMPGMSSRGGTRGQGDSKPQTFTGTWSCAIGLRGRRMVGTGRFSTRKGPVQHCRGWKSSDRRVSVETAVVGWLPPRTWRKTPNLNSGFNAEEADRPQRSAHECRDGPGSPNRPAIGPAAALLTRRVPAGGWGGPRAGVGVFSSEAGRKAALRGPRPVPQPAQDPPGNLRERR